jgi:8-hydroxy-5-deazaflavin:NADPH oxidoreductase
MVIAILGGTGQQGKGLAKRFVAANHVVLIGSRDQAKAIAVAAKLKEELTDANIAGGDNASVVKQADIVILTIPHGSQVEILGAIKEDLRGKVVVDTTVPMVPGRPPQVLQTEQGSSAQLVQEVLGDETSVVGAFHTVSAHLLNDLSKQLDTDTVVCGNSDEAKQLVITLAGEIGVRGINGGSLTIAHTLERITVMLIGMNMLHKKRSIGIQFTNI